MKQLTTQEKQAILDGRKTQFREVIELPFKYEIDKFVKDERFYDRWLALKGDKIV